MESKVYGQHLANKIVLRTLKAQGKYSSKKAVALSFQGSPGVGKSYTSDLIAKSMYVNGRESSYVHYISAARHFSPNDPIDTYQVRKLWYFDITVIFTFTC